MGPGLPVPAQLQRPAPGSSVGERADLVAEVARSLSERGRALLIGEPGVGRSTVLDRVGHRAEESGARVLRVRPGRSSASTPLIGLADLLSEVADAELGVLPLTERRALESVRSPGPDPAEVPHRLLLRLAVARAFRALRRSGPVVVSVDDWTRLDAESADVIGYLTTRATHDGGPALVATQVDDTILSGRRCPVDRALFPPGTVHLVPSLSPRALAGVLAERRGGPVPPDLLLDVHGATGGNPSWALELLDQQARLSVQPHLRPRLPESVAETVLDRVRLLPPSVQQVLAVCAATGGAPARAAVALSGTDLLAVATATEEGVVLQEDEQLVAAHPLLGAAALRVLGIPAQLEIHARAAVAATGLRDRARHLDRALLPGADGVVATALAAAAEQTWAEGDREPAMVLAGRALARTARASSERAGRAVRLAEMAVASASSHRAATVLADLDLVCLAPPLLDRALPLLVAALGADASDEAAQRALAALAAQAVGDGVRGAMIDVRRVFENESAPDRAARARRASELLAGEDLPAAQHRALALLLGARLDAGHGLDPVVLGRMRALEADLPTLPLVDTADAAVGLHAYEVGELAASRVQLEVLAGRAERSGQTRVAELFRVHLAVVELLGGRQAKAAALLQWFDGTGPGPVGPPEAAVRARASLALVRGDRAALDAALAPPAALGNPLSGRITRLVLRGAWATAHERWAEAVPVLSEALALAAERGCDEPGRRLWADTMLGPGLVALGRLEEADQVASHLESLAPAGGGSLLGGHALRLRGLMAAASGDLARAQAQLQRAVDVLAEGQLPVDHARSLLDLGRVLRRRRARTECRRVLDEVLAIARRTGDRPLLALVERELTRPGRAGAPDVLTAAEQRVAASAAAGLRNREIAAACFVSVRTVETQLSTVYRKLGVRSRVELAARLRVEAPA